MSQINCCDGCQRGLPITELGFHRTESELFGCTKARYQPSLEPMTTDTWHQKPKAKSGAPFTCGDLS